MLCTITDICLYNARLFEIIKNLHMNLNVLALFLYMISFSGMLNKSNEIKDIYKIILFSIISLFLLYKANEETLMYIIGSIYFILIFLKLRMLSKIKNTKILKIAILLLLILFIQSIVSYQQMRMSLSVRYDNQIQERVLESKMFGTAELKENKYIEYVYMNFSYYSFVYLIENYGKFLGVSIITVLILLLIKFIKNYQTTNEDYGKFLSLGIGCFLFIPLIINFFTRIGFVNFASIDIPFIVHNDMSIIIYLMSTSIIMSIYSRKKINISSIEIKKDI